MTILATNISQIPVSELKLHPKNPRKGSIKAISESIAENGFTSPLIVQKSSMTVLAGNHRLKSAVNLGMTTVPVILVDVDDDRALKILLADNRASDLGENDATALAILLQDIAATSDSLAGTCYTSDDLAYMLVKAEVPAEFREYDESAADKVKMCECPSCGHSFPR